MPKSASVIVSSCIIASLSLAACGGSGDGPTRAGATKGDTTTQSGGSAGVGVTGAGGATVATGAGAAATAGTGASNGGGGVPSGTGDATGSGGAAQVGTGAGGGSAAGGDTGGPGPDGGAALPLEQLITANWTLPPATESYTCARKTITDDLYVDGFAATSPLGTHHTLLTMGPPDKADGIAPCSVFENRTQSIFSSGVGTQQLTFPPGIALKIAKGSQLLLNLHLFNTATDPLSGVSGTSIHTVDPKDVKYIAEEQLAGTVFITLPPHTKTTTIGGCLASSDVTIFAVAPHMHKLGVYLKAIGQSSVDGERVLFDGPYDFDNQSFSIVKPLKMKKGDNVRVECTHDNTTDQTVSFGESTLSEMCFAGLYRYPADGTNFICTTGPTQ